ncbi:MAG: 50S ribosomal protein L13 [Patescibacteria group bacterium]
MAKNENHNAVKIDAKGQVLGRLASRIASILMGKDKPTYKSNVCVSDKIEVINISKIKLTGKKISQKRYYHFSGYPGGLKVKKISEIMADNPALVLEKAVTQMLPKNKLRNDRMKNLIIKA